MRIINLASGSKANSTFISFGETKILIDAGLTEKKLKERYQKLGRVSMGFLRFWLRMNISTMLEELKA